MTDQEIRLECLKLARPDGVLDPDGNKIVERARVFLAFVTETAEAKRGPGRPRKIADKP